MPKCPICDSRQVVVVLGATRRAVCRDCGARWLQDGSEQLRVKSPGSSGSLIPASQAVMIEPSS
jgi:transposase-like protein